jgi:hypothetical protein
METMKNMKKIVLFIAFVLLFQMNAASAFIQDISSFKNNSTHPNINSVENANYIILTTSDLEDAVIDFKTWKEYPGLSVEIINVTWIADNYNGVDIQEQIRNFLIDKYDEWNIQYLLIVGSRDMIPMRRCDPIEWDYGDYYYTDFYYSDITGDWDQDNDGKFAEYEDDSVDFIPEISVGRIPGDDEDTVEKICGNIMRFGSDTGSWKKNVLLLGAISYYEGLESFGWTYERSDCGTIMEECRIDIFDPEGFNCFRMYEAEGLRPSTYDYELPLEHTNAFAEWTNGYSVVNMIGHSNEDLSARWIWDHDDGDNIPEVAEGELIYKDILTRSDSRRLTLEKPPIVFSGGCSQLHGSNNMGRSFIEDGAAVAYIGSTDLGFYNITRVWKDERDGGFGSLDYYFFYYLISQDQTCGDALSNSKLYFSNHFMFDEYDQEWIYRSYSTLMATTLYGDPSLGLYPLSNPPSKPDTPEGPNSGRTNVDHIFSTFSNDPEGDEIRYLFDWGDGNNTLSEYIPSGEIVQVSHQWKTQGIYNLSVKAQDEHGVWSEWSDPLSITMPKDKSFRLMDQFRDLVNYLNQFKNVNRIISKFFSLHFYLYK